MRLEGMPSYFIPSLSFPEEIIGAICRRSTVRNPGFDKKKKEETKKSPNMFPKCDLGFGDREQKLTHHLKVDTCRLPCPSIHGIFQARILEWVAISFSRRSSQPRDRTRVSRIVGRHFTIWATREVEGRHTSLKKSITIH